MSECENLEKCRFFDVLEGTRLQSLAYDLISVYCRGPFISQCHRKQHLEQGRIPSRELSPAGISFNL